MHAIQTVGLICKPAAEKNKTLVPELVAWLHARDIAVRYDDNTATYLGGKGEVPREDVPDGAQLIVVLGGDGTLLSAARAIAGREIPLFAVNLGGLGFLTAISVDELYPELERALRGEQRIGLRSMLECRVIRGERSLSSYDALNDVVLTKAALARVIDLEVHVDTHFIGHYKADGLIISTPTGSTAYSLAAGGPILSPDVPGFVITPVASHALTNRPLVIQDTAVIEVRVTVTRAQAFLTVDGQQGIPLAEGDVVQCKKSEFQVKLFKLAGRSFFDVLRTKLKWGER